MGVYSLLDVMDLNLPLVGALSFRTSFNIKIVVRRKITCRDTLVRKYGEEGFATIIASDSPLIISGYPSSHEEGLCIFVII